MSFPQMVCINEDIKVAYQHRKRCFISHFVDVNKLILKFVCRSKRLRIANTTLKNKKVGLTLPDFKTQCSNSNQDSVQLMKKTDKKISKTKHEHRRGATGLHKHSQSLLDKGAKAMQWSKNSLFFFFLAVPHSSWDLIDNSLTRDGTWTKAMKALSPNCQTDREFPKTAFLTTVAELLDTQAC